MLLPRRFYLRRPMASRARSEMTRKPRTRFWTETALAAFTAVLCLLTLVWPAWIEAVSGVDPDGGNGALEWALRQWRELPGAVSRPPAEEPGGPTPPPEEPEGEKEGEGRDAEPPA